ncbi:hypothetical protein COCNU_16G001630 [Cocos nucifera]|uniref:Uncharacterized protein n=1 Tax=Cocos nucifera TaxID=13894 RepID=A0A8K0IY88_COCNU|nr:hypothetical protein COCNU_16G001630 [Cocos nucifera]
MALMASIRTTLISSLPLKSQTNLGLRRLPVACLSASSSSSGETIAKASHSPSSSPPPAPFVDSTAQQPDAGFEYELAAEPSSNAVVRLVPSTESTIERGCVYIVDAYKVYWTSCLKGVHTGQMVLRLVEAIDVYLAGTVMLIFGMGLYGLFISNVPRGLPPDIDRALKGSSLFGMFALKIVKIQELNIDQQRADFAILDIDSNGVDILSDLQDGSKSVYQINLNSK